MSRNRLSRRRAVRLSGSLLVAGLAGCPADPNGAGTATKTGGDTTAAGDTEAEVTSELRTATAERAETVGTDAETPGDGNFTFAPGRGDDPPVAVDGERVVESFRVTVA